MQNNERFCVICDPTNVDGGGDLDCTLSHCAHEFHYGCIQDWVTSRTNTCPICRAKVTSLRRTKFIDGQRETHSIRVKKKTYTEDEEDILHIVQFLSESEDLDDVVCHICLDNDRGHELMLCSTYGCESAAHFDCLDPPLSSVPEGDWFCPACAVKETEPPTTEEPRTVVQQHINTNTSLQTGTCDELRRASNLDNITEDYEGVFAQATKEEFQCPPKRVLIDTPEKEALERNENRIILDTPQKQPDFYEIEERKRASEMSPPVKHWKTVTQSNAAPRQLDFHKKQNFKQDIGMSSTVTSWKTVAPTVTKAPSIVYPNLQSQGPPEPKGQNDGFQKMMNTYKYQPNNLPVGEMDNHRQFGHTFANRNDRRFTQAPTISGQMDTQSSAPHRSFPIHRTSDGPMNTEVSPKRKRQIAENRLTQPQFMEEVRQTLKELIRAERIVPVEAVLIQKKVEKEISERRTDITSTKAHQVIQKFLNSGK